MGGRIHAGFTAYNFLNLLTTPIITYNIGTIDCSSLALYLMSDHRYVCERCKFILATFEWTFYRNTMYFPEIIEAYENLDLDRCFLAEIFQEKTDGSIDLTACLRGSTKILDGEAATAAGIATCTSGAKPAVPELAKMWVIHD